MYSGLISRRKFMMLSVEAAGALSLPSPLNNLMFKQMKKNKQFDVIIVGGSYAGLAAAMALGRALMNVLVVDSGKPCNRQTPHSHNFLTNDGKTPAEIAETAREQVSRYKTIDFFRGLATSGKQTELGFEIQTANGDIFGAKKVVFATGIKDQLPAIEGLSECWGVSVLHCPYCHGYEVRNEKTGILGNGDLAFDFTKLISNWTKDLTIFTNGASTLTAGQHEKLQQRRIKIVEKEIERLVHHYGYIQKIHFKDGTKSSVKVLYAPSPFEQHCKIPESMGCELTEQGYLKTDAMQETTVKGVYAIGDNAGKMRTVANAVAMGTTAGMTISKQMILEGF